MAGPPVASTSQVNHLLPKIGAQIGARDCAQAVGYAYRQAVP
jgi:hypothetical protein